MRTIAFGTLKGGTGKTTVAYNIAGILAEEHRVLLVDVDPQANLSDNAGIDTTDQDARTIKDVFENPKGTRAEDIIAKAPMWQLPNLDIIPGHIRLTAMEKKLVVTTGREYILKRWFEMNHDVLGQYDYILLDSNPSMGTVNENAFLVADSIVLVSDVSRKAVQGAELFVYLWGESREELNIPDNVKALVINNSDKRIALSRQLEDYYREDDEFGKLLMDTVIPSRVDIKNTELKYLPINITAPNSDSCDAFRDLVSELIRKEVF